MVETEAGNCDVRRQNMPEPTTCLFSRIPYSLWYIQNHKGYRKAHSGNRDKGRARISSFLPGLSQVERARLEHLGSAFYTPIGRRFCYGLRWKSCAGGS